MCYTSHTDQCAWKKANYEVEIFNKVATDEWQICEGDEGSYICPTRYPGNMQWRLNSTLNAVSMEDSPFEAYKTKTTALGTNFFLSEDDLKSLNETCPIERKLKGADKCSGSYNNAVFTQFPPFAYQACQCPERITQTVEEVIVKSKVAVKDEDGQDVVDEEGVVKMKVVETITEVINFDYGLDAIEMSCLPGEDENGEARKVWTCNPSYVNNTVPSESPCVFKFKIDPE